MDSNDSSKKTIISKSLVYISLIPKLLFPNPGSLSILYYVLIMIFCGDLFLQAYLYDIFAPMVLSQEDYINKKHLNEIMTMSVAIVIFIFPLFFRSLIFNLPVCSTKAKVLRRLKNDLYWSTFSYKKLFINIINGIVALPFLLYLLEKMLNPKGIYVKAFESIMTSLMLVFLSLMFFIILILSIKKYRKDRRNGLI